MSFRRGVDYEIFTNPTWDRELLLSMIDSYESKERLLVIISSLKDVLLDWCKILPTSSYVVIWYLPEELHKEKIQDIINVMEGYQAPWFQAAGTNPGQLESK